MSLNKFSDLLTKAKSMADRAYVPYSRQASGACLLTKNGNSYLGCAVESASYGASLCAVMVCVGCAIGNLDTEFEVLAIHPSNWPSGLTRQFLIEFNPELQIVRLNSHNEVEIKILKDLLPHYFGAESLQMANS